MLNLLTYHIDNILNWFNKQIIVEKLDNPLGTLILSLVALSIGLAAGLKGILAAILIFVVIVGLPSILTALINLRLGMFFILCVSFFISMKRFIPGEPPIGLVLDVFIMVLFIGLFIRQITERNWGFAANPITPLIIVWIVFNLMEVLNPIAASRIAWLYVIRGTAGLILLYFIALYNFKSYKYLKFTLKVIILLMFFAGAYGCKQHFIGFAPKELAWIFSDPERAGLFIQWGMIRAFSFMAEPASYGIAMAYMSFFCYVLMLGPYVWWKKVLLAICSLTMLGGMAFSGTRTAYGMIPMCFMIYTLLTLTRTSIITTAVLGLLGLGVILMPTGNVVIVRIQSTFKPYQDESMVVRLENQAKIQPFIRNNPMGGGLGSSGEWGQRFSPGTMLAKFPPDSGYMRCAVEQGWLGLLLYFTLLFSIMVVGVRYYVRVKNPKIQNFYVAILTAVFSLIIAEYPQESIGQAPTSMVFYIFIAALIKLKDFDEEEEEKRIAREKEIAAQLKMEKETKKHNILKHREPVEE